MVGRERRASIWDQKVVESLLPQLVYLEALVWISDTEPVFLALLPWLEGSLWSLSDSHF